MKNTPHTVLIIGGGFAGVRCALSLANTKPSNMRVILVSDRPHFEYHGALYRIVTGHSPLEVCLPLREIFAKKDIEVCEDRITAVNPEQNVATGKDGTRYQYDDLVLAVGAETIFFNIPGMEERSHGIKTIADALRLKSHLHKTMEDCANGTSEDKLCGSNIAVVGGGATGVEIAAELAVYMRDLARHHGIEPSLINIELIEAGERILPTLPEKFTKKIDAKIRALGVNVFTKRAVTHNNEGELLMDDMQLKTRTVIWTAGVKGNQLVTDAGIETDKRGRAIVGTDLRAKGFDNIYVAGDAAATPLSGMAQTALQNGIYIADSIIRRYNGWEVLKHAPLQSIYAIPVGPGWAGALFYGIKLYGKFGWFVRRTVDFVVFISLLSPKKALHAMRAHHLTDESCKACVDVHSHAKTNHR